MNSNFKKQEESKDYLFRYTTTLNPLKEYSPEEIAELDRTAAKWAHAPATIGEYHTYFHLSNLVKWSKKKWVPIWLWKLVADGDFIDT